MTPIFRDAPLRVYIENNRARDLAYYVTEDAVRRALADVVELSLVVDRYRGEVDVAVPCLRYWAKNVGKAWRESSKAS